MGRNEMVEETHNESIPYKTDRAFTINKNVRKS